MNGRMTAHGKHMLVGGTGVALLAIVFGVGWQQAVTWGLLLACPLGMMGIMWFMGRQSSGGHQRGAPPAGDAASRHGQGSDIPAQLVSGPTSQKR